MKKWGVLACLLLSGCAVSDTVHMEKAGQRVTCGPYANAMGIGSAGPIDALRDCVSDFQRQGYQRVAK